MPADQEPALPLFFFFDRLRQNEFPLGTREYENLLTALQKWLSLDIAGYRSMLQAVQTDQSESADTRLFMKARLLHLCKLLWLKPNQSVQLFEEIFEATFALELPAAKQAPPLKTDPEPATPTGSDAKNQVPPPQSPQHVNTPSIQPDSTVAEAAMMNQPVPVRIALQTEAASPTLGIEQAARTELEKSKFLFTSNFFPLDRRKTQQNLKQISSYGYAKKSMEIDVEATIRQTVANGFFTGVQFRKQLVNTTSLMLLIDHDGSMVAFDQLTDNIRAEAEEALMPDKNFAGRPLKTFYFYNTPAEYLYTNHVHTHFERTAKALPGLRKKSAGVIILSDAGAARSNYSRARVQATTAFLARLQHYTTRIAWLNPLPADRWVNTSASEIAEYVAMFEATESGVKKAVDLLRGSAIKIRKEA
jgi:uncharacterized protein with von Willebrand factor type A (vWA) domain